MAELADALDSGSSLCKEVQVQVLLPAPYRVFITKVMNTRYFFAYISLFGAGFLLFFFCYAVVGRQLTATPYEHSSKKHNSKTVNFFILCLLIYPRKKL